MKCPSCGKDMVNRNVCSLCGYRKSEEELPESSASLPAAAGITTCNTGKLILVEKGSFHMGALQGLLVGDYDGALESSRPAHPVTLTYDFYIGKYQVTFYQYDAFCDDTGRAKPSDVVWEGKDSGGRGTRPVIWVSWWDAVAYCNWLSEKEGLPVAYRLEGEPDEGQMIDSSGNVTADITRVMGYRLPTEAEWEYAARGGNISQGYLFAGSNSVDEVAWYCDNTGGIPHEVGTKAPNELGIHDMSGNVGEWCNDWWTTYTEAAKTNPCNTAFGRRERVARGGSANCGKEHLCTVDRDLFEPDDKCNLLGFRIARTVQIDFMELY